MKRQVSGALLLSAGGLLAKAVGALYRVPLVALLGGYGMGLYQMAYPIFCLALTFSSAGVSAALSRIIAGEHVRGREDGNTVREALRLFFFMGAAGALLMAAAAPLFAALQEERELVRCILFLAPSVLLVALLAVFRGYFQGKGDMVPTALSELTEAGVKAAAGLLLAAWFRGDPARAAAYALLGVTLSEGASLALLAVRYRGEHPARMLRGRRRDLLAGVLPVMASAAILPLSGMLDSVLIVRLLGGSRGAVAAYGLFSGAAVSLVSVASTASSGLAVSAVPALSSASEGERGRAAGKSLALTALFALPCAVGLFFFAPLAVRLLFPTVERELLVSLIRASALSALFLPLVETSSACLVGMGGAKCAARAMTVAVAAKTAAECVLVPMPKFGILGAAISADLCYLVAFFLDLIYTVRKCGEAAYDHGNKSRNGERGTDGAGARGAEGGGRSLRKDRRASRCKVTR